MRAFESDVIDFNGDFYKYRDFVVQAKPVQQPHPPIFYGAPNADAITWGVPQGINVVSLGPADRARAIGDRYRQLWAERGHPAETLPFIGITRHIVVARTDDEAKHIARARYPRWRAAIEYIWRRSKTEFTLKDIYPPDFDGLEKIGHGIAGSPATVRAYLETLERQTGVNYVLCQMIFGDMTEDEATASLTLFGQEVMPAFRR
jgi:alkanesulfonate monooxygenase SsuD/methylene tetrahydromethanopterin reductase-like flavin-dependent oxidoreductase (luciferase family)